jgi:hypothetical protein
VIEGARRLRLLLEAVQPLGIRGVESGKDLDRDLALQPRVPGPVDLSHPPRAQRCQDLVGPEARAGREPHLLL